MKKGVTIYVLLIMGLLLCSLPSGEALDKDGGMVNNSISFTCGNLQTAINAAASGSFASPTIINVTGTCNGNVVIDQRKNNITLSGGGTATIHGVNATKNTVRVLGKGIVIKGFNITGGYNGIQVDRGGTAVIDGNNIHNTQNNGISVGQVSHADIINNTIQNNPNQGIAVSDNSSAHIGFINYSDTTAKRNTIQGNGNQGIQVQRSASATIVKNTIQNNISNGIHVSRASHADISGNVINGNGDNGVKVDDNSGVNLGKPGGTTIFDLANTTTVNNLKRGLNCDIGGYADGLLGTLNGAQGDALFDTSCIDNLQ
jgi:parallel beta-helix repeat protein